MNENEHRVIVDGVDLMERFGLILNVKDSKFNPPKPRLSNLVIPGRDGVLDLTDYVTGDTVYEPRNDVMVFGVMYPEDFSAARTRVMNFLHGRRLNYRLSWEMGYTYTARFSVDEHYSFLHYGEIKVDVMADPWRLANHVHVELPAASGVEARLLNRRRRVSPTISCLANTVIGYKTQSWELSPGTHFLSDLLLDPGENTVYIDSKPEAGTNTWNDVLTKLGQSLTWAEISEMRWSELAKYGQTVKDDALSTVQIDYDTYDL